MEFNEIITVEEKARTADVLTTCSFETLMISASTISSMMKNGFRKPSPIQEKAIPAGLSGLDVLVQAKSGTGKTLVFSVMSVENLNLQSSKPQRLIVAPTREIACQIRDTVLKIASKFAKVVVLVGGNNMADDIQLLKGKAHIIIGTTGRICHMVQDGHLSLDSIDLFVLDEADKLMEGCFEKDINYLFSCIPENRQVAVFSATYPRNLDQMLCKFMKDVTLVRLNSDDVQLVGIKQYAFNHFEENSLDVLVDLCRNISFNQMLVFCNKIADCQKVSDHLVESGFDCMSISSQMTQAERDSAIQNLKNRKIKILVSSDLTARGVDAENVNLVINMEPALNVETYLHRIGRAARFGGIGAAITLLKNNYARSHFYNLHKEGNLNVNILIKGFPSDIVTHSTFHDSCRPFKQKSVAVMHRAPDLSIENREGRCYTRSEVMRLRNKAIPLNNEVLNQIVGAKIGSGVFSDFDDDIRKLAMSLGSQCSISSKTAELEPSAPALKKKYVFVPVRSNARKKFYLRGELLSIRNSHTPEMWHKYALTKFDLTEHPFLQQPVVKNIKVPDSNRQLPLKKEPVQKKRAEPAKKILKYNRKDMLALQMRVPKSDWIPYVKSKWDTTEEPWQLDPYLRCPFELQLRRIRNKEKNERAKIVSERLKEVNKESNMAIACSRSIPRNLVTETSFDDFFTNLRNAFSVFSENAILPGPVIPKRDSPSDWKDKVEMETVRLNNFGKLFNYDVEKLCGVIAEASCGGKLQLESSQQTRELIHSQTRSPENEQTAEKVEVIINEKDCLSNDHDRSSQSFYDIKYDNDNEEKSACSIMENNDINNDYSDNIIEQDNATQYSSTDDVLDNESTLGNILSSYIFLSTRCS